MQEERTETSHLKGSLGGKIIWISKICMFPELSHIQETHNTGCL